MLRHTIESLIAITMPPAPVRVMLGRVYYALYQPLDPLEGADVRGKVAIVTGSTSGIGLETAKALLKAGAHVIMACRTTSRAETLLEQWRAELKQELDGEVERLDLCSLDSVREFCKNMADHHDHVDILINNAGIFSMAQPREETDAGHESHLGINYLAHALLTSLLWPLIKKSDGARIVHVASHYHDAAQMDFNDMHLNDSFTSTRAYTQSKLAQIMFAREFHRRLPESINVKMFSVCPGNVITDVVRTLPKFVQFLYRTFGPLIFLSPKEGAGSSLYAAASPEVEELSGGEYLTYCTVTEPSPFAANHDNCRKLWLWTCRELAIDENWPSS